MRPQPAWLSDLPGLLAQWHPTRNGPLDPLTLRVGSHRRVWWQCAQGHEWQAGVGSRTQRETGCPVCSGRRVSPTRNLAALYPEIATTWHPTGNAPLTPDEVSPASSRRVWWRCAAGHEWQVAVANRVMYDCPFCSGRRVTAATSLAALYPNVAREWHPRRNGTRTPETVKPRSSTRRGGCAAGVGMSGGPHQAVAPCVGAGAGNARGVSTSGWTIRSR